MRIELWRRLIAEAAGTALLVAVVVGSGIMATQLSPGNVGLQLLYNSFATALGLTVLILAFGPVSGAHFNPVVSAADWLLGRRDGAGLPGPVVVAYTVCQVAGAIAGTVLAHAMFDLKAVDFSTHDRDQAHLLVGEVVATAGLVFLIFSLVRTGRASLAAPAVGAYIGSAYWFTSSTSFANPAVTAGRAFTDTFAGIAPASVPGFVAVQFAGGLVGLGLLAACSPRPEVGAADAVVPHGSVPAPAPGPAPGPAPAPGRRGEPKGGPMSKPSVLFVCVHNAGRSQMAAGWLAHLGGDAVEVRSAGSAPAGHVNPVAVAAMGEVGIDITSASPKILTAEAIEASDVVVTMGCGDACPIFPGKRYEDWKLDDPAGQGIDAVRQIRDEIRTRVEGLLDELRVAAR